MSVRREQFGHGGILPIDMSRGRSLTSAALDSEWKRMENCSIRLPSAA